ncbi:MAG TPA: response regulator [Chloroflexi bacterium]|nr:response regulator [Chloroflexota bacterium]
MVKILYVEDNFQNFRLVTRMLMREPEGYEIIQAPDGKTALKLAAEWRPDLILMDINLPDIDGEEVTRRIKANPDLQHIPVIALTANVMVGDRERYLEAGCDGYLGKPIMREQLREALHRFLSPNGKGKSKPGSNATAAPPPPRLRTAGQGNDRHPPTVE